MIHPIILYTKGRLLLLLFIRDGKDGFTLILICVTGLPLTLLFRLLPPVSSSFSSRIAYSGREVDRGSE
ncbi:hypothetical protein RchiOBHm_Chr5g0048561 [Rosa chinensis]|uniref:Uncharacterized protein n=1 Tax=Rosa chinensis TaxID=74649 RepID=A0A2P6QEQ3_ROSCH|nr:hypothetical protein RchiOBHm_Chr5g0048561 [Rosa chinensis]